MSPYCRDGQKITSILFLTDNIDQDGQNTNQNQMKNTFPFFTLYFKFWRHFLEKFVRCSCQTFLLFLLTFTSAIIFHKFLELHSTLSGKKKFFHEFSLFNGFTQTLPLLFLNSQNVLCVTKVSFLSLLPYTYLLFNNKPCKISAIYILYILFYRDGLIIFWE